MSASSYRLLFWLGLLLLGLLVLGLVQSILMPFATGFALAYVLAPGVARVERMGVRRSLASLCVLALFLLGLALLLVILVPLIQGQVVQLIGRMPTLVRMLQDQVGQLILVLQQHLPAEDVSKLRDMVGAKLAEALTWLAGLVQGVITSSFAILNIVSLVVVTPIVTFFLLRDWERMVAQIDSYLPRQSVETVRGQARLVSDTLAGFIHGQALICLILAIYYGVALTFAGLTAGLALGLLIGVLAIIPMLGVATGFVLAVGLAASQYGSWTEVVVVAAIFAVGQLAEANILTPKLLGDRIHLHPVWVIFALFAGGTLYGFVGVLIAVPAAAVLGVLARFALSRYRRSSLYDAGPPAPGEPIEPPDETVTPLTRVGMTQLAIDLPHRPALGRADFLVSDCNAAALAWMERWPDWPGTALVLHGPAGCGKSHLAHLWQQRSGAALVIGERLRELDPSALAAAPKAGRTAVAIDDAENAPERALLHLYNCCAEAGATLLVVARAAPAAWPIALADLASRLRAAPAAAIARPDDALLAALLVKHFADRQVRVAPGVIAYLVPRMERSFAAAAELAAGLDRLALRAARPITIKLARRVLADAADQPSSPIDFGVT